MPQYTSPLNIPYATTSDTLKDSVSTIPQQAAEKVDDLLTALPGINAAGPVAVTPAPNWTTGGNVYRRAGMAYLALNATRDLNAAWGANTLIATIPVGYRPLLAAYAFGVIASSGQPAAVLLEPGGAVRALLSQGAGSVGVILSFAYAI